MAEIQLDVYGATSADESDLERELSDIFGAPAETDATEVVTKVVLAEVAKRLVALVCRPERKPIRIEIDVKGVKLMVDGATSPEQVIPLLQLALSQR